MKKDKYKGCKPETMMMSYGYIPELSENSVKPPVFLTSTFTFEKAEDGKRFFEILHGAQLQPDEKVGLIYSRMNNPGIEILEDRLTCWENAESAVVFASGMSAISTLLFALCKAGDDVVFSEPLYAGSLFKDVLPRFGVRTHSFFAGDGVEGFRAVARGLKNLRLVFLETPANPTNILLDIEAVASAARGLTSSNDVVVAVDNTFLGPVFQRPLSCGADISVYSATKFLGGHSDTVAGACYGKKALMAQIRKHRVSLGTNLSPFDGWLILRSLETLKLRMDRQSENAQKLAAFLVAHPKIQRVIYPGLLRSGDAQYDVYKKQCLGPGGLIAFEVKGGQREAFTLLNSVKLIQLAVSLGGTETLIQHPNSMTHSGMPPAQKEKVGISDALIRLSVGIEDADDLIRDLAEALKALP